MSMCRLGKKEKKGKRYSELWITKFHACNRCVGVIKFQISVKSKLGNVCTVDSKLVCAISLSKCWFRTSVTGLEGRYKVNARLHRRYIMCFNGTEPHNDSGIFTSWDNVQFRSQSLCLRIKFTRLPLVNFGYFNRLTKILSIHRPPFFSFPFFPKQGKTLLEKYPEISRFFFLFFNISNFSSSSSRRNERETSKNFNFV